MAEQAATAAAIAAAEEAAATAATVLEVEIKRLLARDTRAGCCYSVLTAEMAATGTAAKVFVPGYITPMTPKGRTSPSAARSTHHH